MTLLVARLVAFGSVGDAAAQSALHQSVSVVEFALINAVVTVSAPLSAWFWRGALCVSKMRRKGEKARKQHQTRFEHNDSENAQMFAIAGDWLRLPTQCPRLGCLL